MTLPARDLAASIAFYRTMGFVQIVRDDHYARVELPPDNTTLSLHLTDGPVGNGPAIYFECDDLDARVAALKQASVVFDSGPEDKSWLWREAWLRDLAGNRVCLYFAGDNRRYPPWRLA